MLISPRALAIRLTMRSLLAFLALLQVPRAQASESSPFCSVLPSGEVSIPGSELGRERGPRARGADGRSLKDKNGDRSDAGIAHTRVHSSIYIKPTH